MSAVTTNSFLDSVGVVTHVGYVDVAWGDWDAVERMLEYTGIRHVREGAPTETTMPMLQRLAENGIKFNLGFYGPRLDLERDLQRMEALESLYPGSVALIEGPNELNLFEYYWEGRRVTSDTLGVAVDIHEELKRLVEASPLLDDVPIISFSLGGVGPWSTREQTGDYSHLTDYSNWHTYFGGEQPRRVAEETYSWAKILNDDPVMFTEAGYHNALGQRWEGVDEATEAKLMLNMLFDNFQIGVEKTFIYALMNDKVDADPFYQEDNFGLFSGDGRAQPVAHAIHNLNAILRDGDDYSATFETGTLDYEISGLPSNGYHTLMQKSDGTFVLAVWAEPDIWDDAADRPIAAPEHRLRVEFGEDVDVAFFDPIVGKSALDAADGVSSFDFSVYGHVVLLQIDDADGAPPAVPPSSTAPAPSPAPAPAPAPRVDGFVDDVLAINFGGRAGAGGFAADATGRYNSATTSSAIAGTANDSLYQSNLWGHETMSFDFAVAESGTYEIELHLSENWSGAYGRALRVFDVIAEGDVVGDDVDIFAKVGANTALVERYTVDVTDGVLDLDFRGEIQNPSIAGLRISRVEERAPDGGAEGEPGFVTAVNLGSNQRYVDEDGIVFEPDNFGIGARASTSAPVAGTNSDTIYQSEAYSTSGLGYDFDVGNGNYLVKLHFAETWAGAFRPGARVFDVVVEGRVVDDDLDVFREAGGANVALEKGYVVGVTDGTLDLDFRNVVQNPAVKAVEIHRIPADADAPGSAETTAPVVVKAVNLGSSTDYTARDGTLFEADDTGVGNWSPVSREIRGTDDDALYRTQVWKPGSANFDFDVENGAYEVELHFAETWGGAAARGARVTDIFLEGARVGDDHDTFAEVGFDRALVKTYRTTVSDGRLDLDLVNEVENPSLAAIKITQLAGEGARASSAGLYELAPPQDGGMLVPSANGFEVDWFI